MEKEIIYKQIDNIFSKVNEYKVSPDLENEIKERNSRKVLAYISNDSLLERYATIVVFSQRTNSALVRDKLLPSEEYKAAFANFSVPKVAKLNPETVKTKYWKKPLTYMTFPSKISAIIDFAKFIQEKNSISKDLLNTGIPKELKSLKDVDKFWNEFDTLLEKMKIRKVRYLQTTTSLLHFLLDFGYDCIKPDSAVVEVSQKIGIVKVKSGDKNLRQVVDFLLRYSVEREIRPSIVDLYFLIDKPQEGAKKYVSKKYFEDHV